LGAGKTTFLRYLQNKLLSQESVIAFYLSAGKIPESALVGWSQLWRFLLEPMEDELSAAEITSCLKTARDRARIVLLVDGLDDLGIADASCFTPLNDLIRVSKNTGAVFAGRPSAAAWSLIQRDSSLLRIKELSPNDQLTFFGEKYEHAVASCRGRRELLATPMYAFMVRKLVREGRHGEIGSLWDLYRRFLHYVFFEHPSNIQPGDHDRWARRVREMLQQVCYQAIDQDIPERTLISERTFGLLPAKIVNRLQELPSAGLVDLVHVDATAIGRSLVFRHDCFQEVLAAEWALASEKRVNHVLHEYWNPKWRAVIALMASAEPAFVLERLYPGRHADDPIHSRLFMAAECVGQAPATDHLVERRIVADLRGLVGNVAFGDAALVSLVKTGGTFAHETAWDAITKDKEITWREQYKSSHVACFGQLDPQDLRDLYAPARLAHLVRSARHGQPLSLLGETTFLSWVPRVSSKLARQLSLGGWPRCLDGLDLPMALMLRLDPVDFERILVTKRAADVASPDPLERLFVTLEMGFQPSAPQIELLIEKAQVTGLDSVARALNVIAAALSDDDLSHIDRRWWTEARCWRICLMACAPRVCARLPKRWIDELVDAVGSDDEVQRKNASVALAECSGRLSASHLERIISYARGEVPDANVLSLVVAVKQDVGADLAHTVLDAIGAPDRELRLVALKSVEKLRSYVRSRHVDLLDSALRMATEWVCSERSRAEASWEDREERAFAVRAVASIGELVRKSTIRYILDTLDVEDVIGLEGLGPTMSRLAQHVDAEQLHELVGRVCSGPEVGKQTIEYQYCPLFVPGRLEKRDIVRLTQLFRVSTSPDLRPVLKALRVMHENGDLSAVDWSADKHMPSREK